MHAQDGLGYMGLMLQNPLADYMYVYLNHYYGLSMYFTAACLIHLGM